MGTFSPEAGTQEVLRALWHPTQLLLDASQLSLQILNLSGLGSNDPFVVKDVLIKLCLYQTYNLLMKFLPIGSAINARTV